MHKKGAIELSANFIIILIISAVVVIGGLGLFFKMKSNAQQYADTLDKQTEENIKSMMLNSGGRLAIYPRDVIISKGDAKLVGVGITNIYDGPDPLTFTLTVNSVKYYASTDVDSVNVYSAGDSNADDYFTMNSADATIQPHEQMVKGVFLKMPKSASKGQYVYTMSITYNDPVTFNLEEYGKVQAYVDN